MKVTSKMVAETKAYDCHIGNPSANGVSGNKKWDAGCSGAVFMSGQPSPEYCTDGKVVVGKNDAELSKHEFGWYAECCFWDGDKCNTDWDKIDCSTSEPPAGPNGAHLGYGCDGARYQGGGFSKEYCTNTDKSTGGDWTGAHNRYPWLQKCCYWDRSDNTCKNNPGEPNMKVTSKMVAETKAATSSGPYGYPGLVLAGSVSGWMVAFVAVLALYKLTTKYRSTLM